MALEFELVILLTFDLLVFWVVKLQVLTGGRSGLFLFDAMSLHASRRQEKPPAMRKMTWEATSPSKPRCEICKGGFGLIRFRVAQKQFCSKQCLEQYLAERMRRVASFKQSIDLPRSH